MSFAISISESSERPKYEQIIHSIVSGIESNNIRSNERLPSINELSELHDIARDTVEKAYKELKRRGIIVSVPGKGYYKKENDQAFQFKVLFLAPEMNMYIRQIIDAFNGAMGSNSAVNFVSYGNDFQTFKRALVSFQNHSTHVFVIPNFGLDEEQAKALLNQVPKHKLAFLDRKMNGITGEYASVCQNWEKEIYQILATLEVPKNGFHTLKLVCPPTAHVLRDLLRGFQRFCIDHNLLGKLVSRVDQETVRPGELFVVVKDEDLIELAKKIDGSGCKAGKEIGVLAFNDNPMKEVLLNGITVIAPNYSYTGERVARMLLNNERIQEESPCYFLRRTSL